MKKIVVFCLLLLLVAALVYFLRPTKGSEEIKQVKRQGISEQVIEPSATEPEAAESVAPAPTPRQVKLREKFPLPNKTQKSSGTAAEIEQASKDYALGKKAFKTLQGHTPRAASRIRAAVVNHELTLISQVYSLSDSERREISDIIAGLFNQSAQGEVVTEEKKLALIEQVVGAESAEKYTGLKKSLQEAETYESVGRRLQKLESELELSTEQSTQIEAALLRLEERKRLEIEQGANSKQAHQARVEEFEADLQSLLSAGQFDSYQSNKPKRRLRAGPNPFSGG